MTTKSWTGNSRRSRWLMALLAVAIALTLVWYYKPGDDWVDATADALDQGDIAGATRRIQAELDDRPNDPLPFLWMSRVRRRINEMDDARQWLERGERRGLTPDQVRREKWLFAAQSGELAHAEPHLGALLQQPGADAEEICRAFVLGYLANLRIQDALRLIESWQADYPHRAEPVFLQAYAFAAINDDARAVELYLEGLELAPDRADMRLRLAESYVKLRQLVKACEQYALAKDDVRTTEKALIGLAQCQFDLGRIAAAREAVADLFEQAPRNADAQLLMGQIDLADERYEDAVGWLAAAVEAKPFRTDARYALAKALQATGRDADAEPHLKYLAEVQSKLDRMEYEVDRAIRDPANAEFRFRAGVAMLRYNSTADGLKWLRSALRVDPRHAGARRVLEEWRDGRFEKFPVPPVTPEPLPQIVRNLADQRQRDEAVERKSLIHFADVTQASGIDFTYRNGAESEIRGMLETLGGGVGVCDFDNNGRLDLMFAGGGQFSEERNRFIGQPNGLFRNLDGQRFDRVNDSARIGVPAFYSHAIAAADFDNDGFVDVLVTGYNGLQLLHNQGDGTFEEVQSSGLETNTWTNSAAWGDINGDGALDLYLVRYLDWSMANHPVCKSASGRRDVCIPKDFAALADSLYLNDGAGRFLNANAEMNIRADGKGLGVLIADVDLDGDSDIYVANDTTENFFYRNQSGALKEVGLLSGCALDESGAPDGSMGVDAADYDGDGLPDLWAANYELETFSLYRNLGGGSFLHASQATGVAAEAGLYVGWGTSFADFDRDGDVDIFVANGHPNYFPINTPREQNPILFVNQNARNFVNLAAEAGVYMSTQHNARGSAIGDFNGDGDLDIVVSHVNQPVSLLENRSEVNSHWVGLRLIGTAANRDAIGTWVELTTASATQVRLVKGGGSYLSTSDNALFFGIGSNATGLSAIVHWPGGRISNLDDLVADRVNTIVETLD